MFSKQAEPCRTEFLNDSEIMMGTFYMRLSIPESMTEHAFIVDIHLRSKGVLICFSFESGSIVRENPDFLKEGTE